MKQATIFLMLLIIVATSFAQQTNPTPTLTKQDYLQKSKNQKTAAWILLGGGAVLTGGSIIWAVNDIFGTSPGPTIMFYSGVASMVGSIPLFIAAGRNKNKAINLSFKMQKTPHMQNSRFINQPVPSINLKLSL